MFGQAVAAHRRRIGLTQEGLATRAGLSVRSIRDLENGKVARPRSTTVRLLADALGLAGGDRERFRHAADSEQSVARSRELPLGVPGFAGRAEELEQLHAAMNSSAAAALTVVTGMAGVGKTALALHWGHQVAGLFPDGQLYVNLHGFDATEVVTDPVDVLRRFLEALGVPADRIAEGADARAGQFRSLLAERRMLMVLDNARDSAQVRPLLPGAGGSVVVVTSREQLSDLVTVEGARTVSLDVLSDGEAAKLLAGRVGGSRLTAEPAATAEIIAATARLPLALAIAAARIAARPTFPLSALAAELSRADRRLEALAEGDLRRVFSWSILALSTDAVRLFQLLGLHPGPDVTAEAAAALAGVPVAATTPWLAELTRQHLLTEMVPGRYAFHDLIGQYARELAVETHPDGVATARLSDFFVAHAGAAAQAFVRGNMPRLYDREVIEPDWFTEASGREWLTAEERNLVAVCRHAAANGPYETAWRIADAVAGYAHARQDHTLWKTLIQAARQAGEQAGDGRVAAFVAYHTAAITDAQREYARAVTEYAAALELCRESWPAAEVAALNMMAALNAELGLPDRAREQFNDALRLTRERGQRFEEAKVLLHMGGTASYLGEQAEALAAFQDCLLLFDLERSGLGRALTFVNIAEVQLLCLDPGSAEESARAALEIGTDTGLVRIQVHSHFLLSEANRLRGRLDTALFHITQALILARDSPDLQGAGKAHHEAAAVYRALGDLGAAVDHLRIAHRTATALPCLHDTIWYSVSRALAEHRLGLLPLTTAIEQIRWALDRAAEVGYLCLEGLAHVAFAELLHEAGAHEKAAMHAQKGITLQDRAGWRANREDTERLVLSLSRYGAR